MTPKDNTRKLVLKQRDSIGISAREQKSRQICDQLIDMVNRFISNADNVTVPLHIAAYEPMHSEVDVHGFLHFAYTQNWVVNLPCMVKDSEGKAAHMVFFPITAHQLEHERPAFLDHPARPYLLADLHAQGWHEIDPATFDVVIVPMVAFDSTLMRLGYGGGNYDRFLPHLRKGCLVAGVAFEEQRIPNVPTEPHDLPLPRILTA